MVVTTPTAKRVEQAIRAVLPAGAPVDLDVLGDDLIRVDVGAGRFTAEWIGEGWLRDALAALANAGTKPEVLVARRMSPGARSAAADARVGWVDESGAAEIALPGLLISRTGRKDPKICRPPRWTPSVIGTAEALILGTRPTVAEVERRTGLSAGSATNALAVLTTLGLLQSDAARGRDSAREVTDRSRLLDAYAEAAITRTPPLSLRVGTSGRDLIDELASLGKGWDAEGVAWAATGAVAASLLGPYLSEVAALDVLVDSPTPATLDSLAERSGLRPIEGGRVLLRPFPTPVTRRLCGTESGLRVAPWPRVYADLRITGVRGEEAAEHLREVVERG
jgi:hypothetical protein